MDSPERVFVIWNFSLTINGASYDVADYFLPIEYAEYILRTDPLVLHQEHFGSATQILDAQRGEVRYTELCTKRGRRPRLLGPVSLPADWLICLESPPLL
jgi:hypothetical protein